MSDEFEANGQCLCGEVKIRAGKIDHHVGVCHCGMCRKWGGGPFFGVDCGSDVAFNNSKSITIFGSSDWAERGFCSRCGTHLFYHLKPNDQYIMAAGLFEGTEDLVLDHQIFIEEKPDYYNFANDTRTMTGAEVFAMYGGEG